VRPGRRVVAATLATVVLAASASACDRAEERRAERDLEQAADVTTCRADASAAATPYGDGFPASWPFPPQTTVYHSEDRGGDGTIVTAISSADFKAILDFMNHDVVDAGFAIEKGETEEHDAEAEWEGNGFHGRWAIRESGECGGETVVQVLSAAD
jgi:hypothetical protein